MDGAKGFPGNAGLAGLPGRKGEPGNEGPTGLTGYTGSKGSKGTYSGSLGSNYAPLNFVAVFYKIFLTGTGLNLHRYKGSYRDSRQLHHGERQDRLTWTPWRIRIPRT